jgi:putative FmdB family regulatory protein
MPIYDFECQSCNKTVEMIVSISASEGINRCPKCGRRMKKMAPNKMTFHLLYDPKKDIISWGNEGYSRTQRYREQDKLAKKNIFPMPVVKNGKDS